MNADALGGLMGLWVMSTNTLVNVSVVLVAAVCLPTVGAAQDARDAVSLFRGLAQTAITQSTLFEWKKLPKVELACIDQALTGRGEDIQQLVRSGIQPSDSRISDIRASCRNQPVSRVAYDGEKSPYIVEGLALGAQVSSGREPYSSYDCGPSEQFIELTWCSKEREEPTIRGGQRLKFSSTYSILHSRDGVALYISRHLKPAWFADNEAQENVDRLSKNFGPPAHVLPMPPQSSVPYGMIVTWGKVALEQLDLDNVGQLAAGHKARAGLMIDHIGNPQRSAQLGLPIYRLTGGAGYVWAASWNRGVGTLQFLAVDMSAIEGSRATAQATKIAPNTAQEEPSPATSHAEDRSKVDALSPKNGRLTEVQKTVVSELEKRKFADEEALKAIAEAKRAAEDARKETTRVQWVAVGGIATAAILLVVLSLVGLRLLGNPTSVIDSTTPTRALAVSQAAALPLETLPMEKAPAEATTAGSASAPAEKERTSTSNHADAGEARPWFKYASMAVLAVCIAVALDYAPLRALHPTHGGKLKVWFEEVFLDAKATEPILVLNIQNRDETPVALSGVSVNDDPKCFPEYANGNPNGPNDAAALNNYMNMMMQILLRSKGINILRDGYAEELKLGEIEKLSLGSPHHGGCTPVKAVVTTDRGSLVYNFE